LVSIADKEELVVVWLAEVAAPAGKAEAVMFASRLCLPLTRVDVTAVPAPSWVLLNIEEGKFPCIKDVPWLMLRSADPSLTTIVPAPINVNTLLEAAYRR
jgi:hypothetical protein